jgi:hypothetical protein
MATQTPTSAPRPASDVAKTKVKKPPRCSEDGDNSNNSVAKSPRAKLHGCCKCFYFFATLPGLHKHLVTHLAKRLEAKLGSDLSKMKEESFKCPFCPRRYERKMNLLTHFAVQHRYLRECLTEEEANAMKVPHRILGQGEEEVTNTRPTTTTI